MINQRPGKIHTTVRVVILAIVAVGVMFIAYEVIKPANLIPDPRQEDLPWVATEEDCRQWLFNTDMNLRNGYHKARRKSFDDQTDRRLKQEVARWERVVAQDFRDCYALAKGR